MNVYNPFIELLDSPYGKYFYDVNRNEIVSITDKTYNALQIIQGKRIGELADDERTSIDSIRARGYLSDKRPSEIRHSMLDYVDDYLDRKISKVTLQVTQACNLRCSYCVYSDINNDLQRAHSAKRMTLEAAKKALDFLWEHSTHSQSVNIGFYGGEPLLEFKLLKQVIEYAEELFLGKQLTFSITSNSTLLNDEIIAYLVKHNVTLTISLDGPEEIHDKSRRFAVDGRGTFKVVFDKVEQLKNNYPDYFSRVLFNMVINPQNDFNRMNSIFADYDYMKSSNVSTTIVDDIYSMEKITYSEDYSKKIDYHMFLSLLSVLGRIDEDKVSPIALNALKLLIKKKDRMGRSVMLSDTMAPSGPCIPGQVRLFVTADGDFYPCERVNESSEVMNIGNVNDGFNMENVRALLNVGSITAEKCRDCWALTNCTLCAKHADDGNCLNPEMRKSFCESVKNNTREQLLDMIALKELVDTDR